MKKNVLLFTRAGACLKNLTLFIGISLFSLSYAASPSASFGKATNVKVGSMTTTSGGRIDLIEAANSRGDVFRGVSEYRPGKGVYYGTFETRANVKNINDVMSSKSIPVVIEQKVGKRPVINGILEKARIGGRALGKGAATVGSAAMKRTPYGIAFSLAVDALVGSKFFWDDEKGDFVKQADDDTYAVIVTKKSDLFYAPNPIDDKKYKEFCSQVYMGSNLGCEFLGFASSAKEGYQIGRNYCKTVSFGSGDNQRYGDGSLGRFNNCATNNGFWVSSQKIHVVKWIDYIPMNEDEFFDEAEPDADKKPSVWVETSGVKPTDEPTVSVPAGTVAQTDPYTDPNDGKTKQTRWDFDKDGRVRETVIPRPDLVPDSPEAPRLNPPSEEDTPNGDKDKDKEKDGEDDKDKEKTETEDLCEKNPDILACQKMGEIEEGFFDEIKIPNITDERTWEEDRFLPTNGVCPAPKVFHVWGKPIQLSYEPLCRFMEQVRFIILVAFILMSAFLVFGSLRKE